MVSILITTVVLLIFWMIYYFLLGIRKSVSENLRGPIYAITLCGGILGYIIIPGFMVNHYDRMEITNYQINKTNFSYVLDMRESPNVHYSYFTSFDTQRFFSEFNDSTKFFVETERSFYGIPLESNIVWSNPPYDTYYKK
jgi:hypothetical protein